MRNLDTEVQELQKIESVIASAKAFIDGQAARTQAAVDAALANGATEAQLQPLTDLIAETTAKSDDLAAAIVANTPAAPAEPPVQG